MSENDKKLEDLKHYRRMELSAEATAKEYKKQAKDCRAMIDQILDAELVESHHVTINNERCLNWQIGRYFDLTKDDYDALDLTETNHISSLVDTMNDIADGEFNVSDNLHKKLVYQMELFKDSEDYQNS